MGWKLINWVNVRAINLVYSEVEGNFSFWMKNDKLSSGSKQSIRSKCHCKYFLHQYVSHIKQDLVYGAMSKIGLLRDFFATVIFVGYFASSNPPLLESSCRHCISLAYRSMATISNFKMADLYRDQQIYLLQSSWKACHFIRLIIRILKMYSLLLCAMFRNGVSNG